MKVLILNQAFYPDVVATSQQASDLARGLSEHGHSVTVIASSRAYDDPHRHFSRREIWNGIEILRIPCTGLGKGAKWKRALDFGTYLIACLVRLLFLGRQDVVIALTSPPLISFLGALFTKIKGGQFVFWVMDMNPDEAIAAGWLKEHSLPARVLQWMLRYGMNCANLIIVLDRFMKKRVEEKGIESGKIRVIPPWSQDDLVQFDSAGRERFRREYKLDGKFVVMYSGNHSPCHPLDTLLHVAERLSTNNEIIFLFVGGGSEFARVQNFAEERKLANIRCLPYQPLSRLAASLSSADMHVVVMGVPFRGIVHPCKIYNVLSIGTPFLYIGPSKSHVVDIVKSSPGLPAYLTEHGDVERAVNLISAAAKNPAASWKRHFGDKYSRSSSRRTLIEEIEASART